MPETVSQKVSLWKPPSKSGSGLQMVTNVFLNYILLVEVKTLIVFYIPSSGKEI